MHSIPFRLARVIFWAALALYLGGIITVGAVVAPQVFDTLKATRPAGLTLPGTESNASIYLDPGQLGGEVFGNVLTKFGLVEMWCLVAMGAAVLLESVLYRGAMLRKLWHLLRIALLICVAGLLLWSTAVTAQVHSARKAWRESGDWSHSSPKWAEFDALHKRAEMIGKTKGYFLLGLLALTALASTTTPAMLPKKIRPAVEPSAAKEPEKPAIPGALP